MRGGGDLPSAHNIAISAKYFGQTADHDIRERQDVYIERISDGLVDHHGEIIGIGQLSDQLQVRGHEEGVSGELAE